MEKWNFGRKKLKEVSLFHYSNLPSPN